MEPDVDAARLVEWARSRGVPMAVADPGLVDEVRHDLERRLAEGQIDAAFWAAHMDWFRWPEGSPLPEGRSLILLAVPRPAHLLLFETAAGEIETLVPPTYVNYRRLQEDVRREVAERVFGGRRRVESLPAPLKSVAARAGLVRYGRNNVTYAEGTGSYHQIVGLITDAPLHGIPRAASRDPEPLASCEACTSCLSACPSGAIGEDRFLLHGERCLTVFSESEAPWPEGLPRPGRACLIGCLDCQEACPENAGLLRLERVEVGFTAPETAALLAAEEAIPDERSRSVEEKIARLDLGATPPLLRRNLRALYL